MSRVLPLLVSERLTDGEAGATSICTAHPLVIEAALLHGLETERRVLIEATCNQVNQDGGYTGMTPAKFRRFVETIAVRVGFQPARIIFGGDHLGPNPWRHLPAEDAMNRARTLIGAYARAGFAKLHLDTSMGCSGEPAALTDDVTAARAASLAEVAEAATSDGARPLYIIGTEVPVPGGRSTLSGRWRSRDPRRPSALSKRTGRPSWRAGLRRLSRARSASWSSRASSSPAPR
jgi:D-tagatose 6-phosphate 4-epimerase